MAETLYLVCTDGVRLPIDANESGLEGFELNWVRLENELYSPSRLSEAEVEKLRDIFAKSREPELYSLLNKLNQLFSYIAVVENAVDFRTWALGNMVCLPCLDPDFLMISNEGSEFDDVDKVIKDIFDNRLIGLKSDCTDGIISTPIAKEIAKEALMQFIFYLSVAYDELHGLRKDKLHQEEVDEPSDHLMEMLAPNLLHCIESISVTIGSIQGFLDYGYKKSGRKPLSKESNELRIVREVCEKNPRASNQIILLEIMNKYRNQHGKTISESTARSWVRKVREVKK